MFRALVLTTKILAISVGTFLEYKFFMKTNLSLLILFICGTGAVVVSFPTVSKAQQEAQDSNKGEESLPAEIFSDPVFPSPSPNQMKPAYLYPRYLEQMQHLAKIQRDFDSHPSANRVDMLSPRDDASRAIFASFTKKQIQGEMQLVQKRLDYIIQTYPEVATQEQVDAYNLLNSLNRVNSNTTFDPRFDRIYSYSQLSQLSRQQIQSISLSLKHNDPRTDQIITGYLTELRNEEIQNASTLTNPITPENPQGGISDLSSQELYQRETKTSEPNYKKIRE